ncbi:hypothetical protein A0H81_08477 [Grifola frondosa]|uniref:Uncharacterized protein n=1 Tax=Grifola frondosa TaxID=5627 RepID=A0A1C7M2M9_GRIFR|nr:hypothetical protein A0H81_08477 [Grifola frondosa]
MSQAITTLAFISIINQIQLTAKVDKCPEVIKYTYVAKDSFRITLEIFRHWYDIEPNIKCYDMEASDHFFQCIHQK